MTEYKRAKLIVTEFDQEDVIITSGETPITDKTYTIQDNDSPNYGSPVSKFTIENGAGWTLWK